MRSLTGLDEADLLERVAVHDMHAVGHHVGDEEKLAVGRGANVLRHPFPRRADDLVLAVRPLDDLGRPPGLDHLRVPEHFPVDKVDLGDGARELAGEDGEGAVDREIGMIDSRAARHVDRVLKRHRRRIAEVEPLQRFGDDNRRFPVRREIHVVGIVDGNRLAGLARLRIHGREAAALRVLGVVGHPQRAQIVRRNHVLRVEADLELVDDLVRCRIDHVDVVGLQVRDVDTRQVAGDGRAIFPAAISL